VDSLTNKESNMRHAHWLGLGLLAAASLGFEHSKPASSHALAIAPAIDVVPSRTVPAGTAIDITLANGLSSESARVGSTWSGTVRKGRNGIPTGSSVTGMVTAVLPARKDGWSMLDLALISVTVEGRAYPVRAETEAVIGGSSRARALGGNTDDEDGANAAPIVLMTPPADHSMPAVFRMLFGGAEANADTPAGQHEPIELRPGATLRFTTAEAARVRARG
jgi:hypothetical protein